MIVSSRLQRDGRRHGRGGRASGFTLVEVLVSLAIMSIILALIGSILTSFLFTEKRISATLARERVGAAILELIQRDVSAVYAYEIPGAFRGTDHGEEDRVEFLSTRATVADPSEDEEEEQAQDPEMSAFSDSDEAIQSRPLPLRLRKVGYFVKQSADGEHLTLFRYEAPYTPPPPIDRTQRGFQSSQTGPFDSQSSQTEEEPVVMEVFDRLKRFSVRYLDADGNWSDSWKEDDLVPRALEISFTVDIQDDPAQKTGYEGAFEESRRGRYETVIGLTVQLPEPDDGQPPR